MSVTKFCVEVLAVAVGITLAHLLFAGVLSAGVCQ